MRKHLFGVAAFGLALLVSVGAARAQGSAAALDQVSAKAQVIVLVPRLSRLSQTMAMLNGSLELGSPWLSDMLGQFKSKSGIVDGLDDNGAALLVVEDVTGSAPKPFLVLPVADYSTFLGNFVEGDAREDAAANAEKATAIMLNSGHEGFARKVGNFVVLADTQAAVNGYQPASAGAKWIERTGTLGAHYLAAGDVSVIVDVEAMSATLTGLIATAQMAAEMQMANMQPEEAKSARAGVQAMMGGLNALVRDGRTLVISADATDAGIGLTWSMQFKDNSPLAASLQGGAEGTAAQHMARLPDKPYFMAWAVNAEAFDLVAVTEAIKEMVEAQNPDIARTYAEFIPAMEAVRGASGLYMMTDGFAAPPVQLTYVDTTDAKAYQKAMQLMLAKMNGMPVSPDLDAKFATLYASNRLKLGEVSVDQYQIEVRGLDAGKAAFPGIKGFLAIHGEQIMAVTAPDMQLLQQALDAMAQGNGLGARGPIDATRRMLTHNPAFEIYIDLGPVASMLGPAARGGARPGGQNPIAMSISVQQGGVAVRQYVPMEVARFIKQVAPLAAPLLQGAVPPDASTLQ